MSEILNTEHCMLCPRGCGVNRNINTGYCLAYSAPAVARAALHMWEEPCISGEGGSGAVFFAGCNMGCVFCQNIKISRGNTGKPISEDRLTDIYFELADKGAHNINLVTADIYLPAIARTVTKAKDQGLKLPFILNTSSYIRPDALKAMDGLIDIYLADLKYIRDEDSLRYSNARGYTDCAKLAIDEMVRQHPVCVFDSKGMLQKGVIVRHLLMPGMLIQAKMTVSYLYKKYGDRVYLSLMNQYTPNGHLEDFPELDRPVTDREYRSLIDHAVSLGITNAYIQEGDTSDTCFIPSFDLTGV